MSVNLWNQWFCEIPWIISDFVLTFSVICKIPENIEGLVDMPRPVRETFSAWSLQNVEISVFMMSLFMES